jgi:hypothetical protein
VCAWGERAVASATALTVDFIDLTIAIGRQMLFKGA